MPQVFEIDGRWYCLSCTAAEPFSKATTAAYPGVPVMGTHCLVASDPRGPWEVAPGPLDGAMPCYRHAARIVDTGVGKVLLGFLHDGPG